RDPADVRRTLGRLRSRRVTRPAFGIVCARRGLDLTVRIVASCASDSLVFSVEAFAVAQAIWLETHILNSARTVHGDLRPGTVTLPAEVRHLLGGQRPELAHGSGDGVSRAHSPQMPFRCRMASRALHPFYHRGEAQARRFDDMRGVAIEALPRLPRPSQPAGGFQQVVRLDNLRPNGQI